MNTGMMRCVVILSVSLCAAAEADAFELSLDRGLIDDVVDVVVHDSDGVIFNAQSNPPSGGGGGGGGGTAGGGAKSLPPQLSGVGLGLQVGAPTSLTIKFAGVQENGIVVGVGAGFRYGGRFATSLSIHADYLIHVATLVRQSQIALTAYVGPGLWLSIFGDGYGFGIVQPYLFNSLFGLGVRMPLGLSMSFSGAPIEVYLELDPALFVFPGIDFGVGASLGFRWHF